MRIRRCASRVLGSYASAPALPRLELPPPPAAHESHAGFVAASASSSSSLEPCKISVSPWGLMDQLDYSDPQEEKKFLETYFVAVAWRPSWLFQPSISVPAASSIKEEEDMAVDVAADDGVIFGGLHVCKKNAAKKKKEMKPNINKVKIKAADESDATNVNTAGGETPSWICKKNVGKAWFCRRPVSQPNSFCSYHSDQKPKRKRDRGVGEGFYYYAGFGSRSKRHRVVSSSSDAAVPEPLPAGQKEEAPAEEGKTIDYSTAVQAQADGADHEASLPVHLDDPMLGDDGIAGIAGDEESSDEDFYDIKTKSPLKKRWRKPVKARSLKSLMN